LEAAELHVAQTVRLTADGEQAAGKHIAHIAQQNVHKAGAQLGIAGEVAEIGGEGGHRGEDKSGQGCGEHKSADQAGQAQPGRLAQENEAAHQQNGPRQPQGHGRMGQPGRRQGGGHHNVVARSGLATLAQAGAKGERHKGGRMHRHEEVLPIGRA
jgi:cell pole-organizing protein PopZ